MVDISILNFAKGMKAKYNAQINAKDILAKKGVNPVLLKCPNAIISLLNATGLCKLIFRKQL